MAGDLSNTAEGEQLQGFAPALLAFVYISIAEETTRYTILSFVILYPTWNQGLSQSLLVHFGLRDRDTACSGEFCGTIRSTTETVHNTKTRRPCSMYVGRGLSYQQTELPIFCHYLVTTRR